ncbi:MAG: sulfotransferase, partial [Gammaproteobacteria bacterium]|nr:sulfotransferase [Gammaproteobacteria bacterium]
MATNPDLQRAVHAVARRQFDEADSLLSGILAAQPGNLQARWLFIRSLESRQRTASVLEQLRLLLMHVKKDLPAIDQIAGHLRQKRYPLDLVLRAYEDYLAHEPGSATAAFNLAFNLARDGQFEAAIDLYERSLELGISQPEEVHLNIANIHMDHLYDHDKARAHLEQALTLNPAYSAACYNLGNLSEQEGKRQEAGRYFEKCLQLDPSNESALARLADTRNFVGDDDPLLARLVATAKDSTNSDIQFAAGKAFEQLADFGTAWRHFSRGNRLDQPAMPAYQPKKTEADFNRIMTICDSKWLQQFEGSSTEPVFICGMFRSGSTLLEQMLASHPAFTAGGESQFFPRLVARQFPDYPEGLDGISTARLRAWRQEYVEQSAKLFGQSSRLTDKRPDNFLYLGLIKAILPSAKVIVTERDWRDVATSIYSVRLGQTQNYATSLQSIRHYIQQQTALVNHWETALGSDLRRVRYEDLVQHPERTMTGLLEWLGESWDERCLAFHELKNSVKTASVWQVREPLHGKSVGRWKNYQRYFVEAFGAE